MALSASRIAPPAISSNHLLAIAAGCCLLPYLYIGVLYNSAWPSSRTRPRFPRACLLPACARTRAHENFSTLFIRKRESVRGHPENFSHKLGCSSCAECGGGYILYIGMCMRRAIAISGVQSQRRELRGEITKGGERPFHRPGELF